VKLLAISGSLRRGSSNTALLEAAAAVVPQDVEFEFYDIGLLPHFNPDLEMGALPMQAAALRAQVGRAGGIVISTPEYAHGLPGSLKNALDWLVGSVEFPNKPVALLWAEGRGEHAQASLREILRTMSARLVADASIAVPLYGRASTADAVLAGATARAALTQAMAAFVSAIQREPAEAARL
jgi:chromate reductase, NAD(P)H dehydrogenase (quinone)